MKDLLGENYQYLIDECGSNRTPTIGAPEECTLIFTWIKDISTEFEVNRKRPVATFVLLSIDVFSIEIFAETDFPKSHVLEVQRNRMVRL